MLDFDLRTLQLWKELNSRSDLAGVVSNQSVLKTPLGETPLGEAVLLQSSAIRACTGIAPLLQGNNLSFQQAVILGTSCKAHSYAH